MKKIFIPLCLLLIAVRAEANFFVADKCGSASTRCQTPLSSAEWKTPTIKKQPCSNPPPTFAPAPALPPVTTTGNCAIPKRPTCLPPMRKDKVVIVVYEGSLKNNVERILRENGWSNVVWKLPVDYRWVGTARITGPTLMSVMDTLLSSFPLEITFYYANHVVTITQRKYHE